MSPGRVPLRPWVVLTVLGGLLLVSAVLSIGVGPAGLSPHEVLGAIWGRLHGGGAGGTAAVIVWDLRLPRIALALLVGGSLAVAGTVMQSLFHNPMADPYIVGVSSGAALGAVIAVALGINVAFLGVSAVPLCAFAGALAVTLLVYGLSHRRGRVPIGTLLLTGIAVGSLVQAVTTLLLLRQEHTEMRQVMEWLMGSLARGGWPQVAGMLPYALVGIAVALVWQRDLNILSLGDDTAHHLGITVERTKVLLLLVSSLLAAGAVAMSGVIAFVGLMVPHLMRLLVGPNHRVLLPASLLGGGLLLLWADVLARTLLPGGEIPISIVTSVIGAPFFLYLLHRREGRG